MDIAKVTVLSPEQSSGSVIAEQKIATVTIDRIGPTGVPGPPGPPGPGGAGDQWVLDETPAGAIDGSNVTFSTTNPFSRISVYLNGLKLAGQDFIVLSDNSFSLGDAPLVGDAIRVDYVLAN